MKLNIGCRILAACRLWPGNYHSDSALGFSSVGTISELDCFRDDRLP
jgi:hypothetical protein